jgi:hypothetical protein
MNLTYIVLVYDCWIHSFEDKDQRQAVLKGKYCKISNWVRSQLFDVFSRRNLFCVNNLIIIAFIILSNSAEVTRKTEFFFYKADWHVLDRDMTDVFIKADNFVIR